MKERRPLTSAEQARVARFTPLATELAGAMSNDWPARIRDDLVSAALLRLSEIAPDFDPRVQDDFWGFAYHHIRGAVLNEALSLTKASARERALYKVAMRAGHTIEGEPVTIDLASDSLTNAHARAKQAVQERAAGILWAILLERAPTPADLVEQKQENAQALRCLRDAVSTLEPRTKVVLDLIYRDGMTHEVVGARLIPPISSKQIQRIHKEARRVLAEALVARGIAAAPDVPADGDLQNVD